jgi:hypothetical protein
MEKISIITYQNIVLEGVMTRLLEKAFEEDFSCLKLSKML